MYSLNLLRIAIELAEINPSYEDIASKFFEHFLYIANAMNHLGGDGARCGMTKTVSFTTPCICPTAGTFPLKCGRWWG